MNEKSSLKTLNLIHKIGKAVFIILGIIFLAVGIYNLIMMFTEEDTEEDETERERERTKLILNKAKALKLIYGSYR